MIVANDQINASMLDQIQNRDEFKCDLARKHRTTRTTGYERIPAELKEATTSDSCEMDVSLVRCAFRYESFRLWLPPRSD